MRQIAWAVLFVLAACAGGGAEANQPAEMQGWKIASGKPLTKAEFAAVVAACEDQAVTTAQGNTLDACLDTLGLKRAE